MERARRGLRPMLRFGSAWLDVAAQITAVTERDLDPRQFILCTDDVHAATLVQEGHMDRVLRHAVELGCDPLVALQMMTINTAQHFGVERDLGCLAPGRYADLVLADNLEEFAAGTVIANGRGGRRSGTPVAGPARLDARAALPAVGAHCAPAVRRGFRGAGRRH